MLSPEANSTNFIWIWTFTRKNLNNCMKVVLWQKKLYLVVYVDTLAYRSVRHNFPNTFYFLWTLTCFDYSFVSNFVHWVSLLWVSNFFLQLSFIECRPVERLTGCMSYAWRPCVNHPLQYFCFEYSQETISCWLNFSLLFFLDFFFLAASGWQF